MSFKSAREPVAVVSEPTARLWSALNPAAVLLAPVVRLESAPVPSAVFWLGRPPSAALAVGENARQASAIRTGRPQRAGVGVSLIIFVLRFFMGISFLGTG